MHRLTILGVTALALLCVIGAAVWEAIEAALFA